ncbi:uncharacterized protein METZ01_LOCUS296611 [marine metagenome]|uniref:Uncharacterized protein n=1 Tax=marine metagenome TaxID=408172 RepID=A0A382M7T3_9ZZZZ
MKEVIMKKLLFWMVLIVGIIAVIGACKKSDDSTTTAAACSSSLSTTASGTLTGLKTTMGVDNVTGTYNLSWQGATPTAGCISSGAVTEMIGYGGIPSDSLNFKNQLIVTSSTSFTELVTYYSDNNSCATVSGYHATSYTNFTVGDNITIVDAPTPYPDYGTKVSYKATCFMAKGVTDTATAFLNSMSTVSGAVTGTELNQEDNGDTYYNIMAVNDNHTSSVYDWLFVGPKSTSAYPDNYSSSSGDVMWQ